MNYRLEVDDLLYAAGGLLGIFALAVFSAESVLGLSPVTKAAVMLLGFMFFLPLGLHIREEVLEKVLYGLALASFLGLVNYTNSVLQDVSFMLFSLSSLVLLGLGYLLRENRTPLGRQDMKIFLGLVLLVTLSLVTFDLSGGQVNHSLVLDNTTSMETGRVELGSMVVTNDFMLPREFEEPDYIACVNGPEGEMFRTPLEIESPEIVDGNTLTQLDIWIRVPEEFRGDAEIKVRQSESCGGENTVTVTRRDGKPF